MMVYQLKRSISLERIEKLSLNSKEIRLVWCDWVNSPSLNYLNLIDFEHKKSCIKAIPWFQCSSNPDEITEFCLRSVFKYYKTEMVKKINSSDEDDNLTKSMLKLLRVTKLFNIACDTNESSFLYYLIAYSLYDRRIKDSNLLLTAWNTLCVQSVTRVGVFSRIIGKHRKARSARLLKYVIQTAQSVRFDFWGAWTQKCHNLDYCPVTAALLYGNVEQICTLLQYGFLPNSKRQITYDNHFMFYNGCLYNWLKNPSLGNGSKRRELVTEVLLILISIAKTTSKVKQISMAECFRLLWSIIPTPFVTHQEVMSEVQDRFLFPPPHCSQMLFYPSNEEYYFELCDYYAYNIMGENCFSLQPRSLKHLSKCVVRSQLREAWNLPSGIEQLPLPPHLKSYLNVINCLQL